MSTKTAEILVSVIVPIYNIQNYVGKCIESILSQTYENLEILLVNDGSPDDSRKVCEAYAEKDCRIRLIDKENGGLSDARNRGIDEALGQYLVFVDGDDYLMPDYVETLLSAAVSHHAPVAICGFSLVEDNGQHLLTEQLNELQNVASGRDILFQVMTDYGYKYVVAWNKIYHRDIFAELRFDKGRIFEDEYINYKMFWNCETVAICKKPLYYYVQRGGSITQSVMSTKKIDHKRDLHLSRIAFYKDKDVQLYFKACQMYCDWLVECIRCHVALLTEEKQKLMQKEIRQYATFAMRSQNTGILRKMQNLLAIVDINIAARVKNIYKKHQQ